MNAYQKNTACTSAQSEAFTLETYSVCYDLNQSAAQSGDLHGLLFDLNCFNLFALYRNYKQRIRSTDGPQLLCASAAGQLVRLFIERIIKHTDQFFLLAPCNSVQMPSTLAIAMYGLLSEVRIKAVGQGRMLGSGRMQIMKAGRHAVDTYSALKEQGEISERLSKFMAYVFQPCKLSDIFAPLAQREQEIRNNQATLMHSMNLVPRRRCPNKSSFSEDRSKRFVIPDSLLYLEQENGTLAYGNPDISSVLGSIEHGKDKDLVSWPIQPPEPNPKQPSIVAFNKKETEQYKKMLLKLDSKSAPTTNNVQPSTSAQCFDSFPSGSVIHTPTGTLIPYKALSSSYYQQPQPHPSTNQGPHLLSNWLQLEQHKAHPQQQAPPEQQQLPPQQQPDLEMQLEEYSFEPDNMDTSSDAKAPLDSLLDDLLDIEEEKYKPGLSCTYAQSAASGNDCRSETEMCFKELGGIPKEEMPQPSPLSSEIRQIFAYLSDDMSSIHEAHLNKELGL